MLVYIPGFVCWGGSCGIFALQYTAPVYGRRANIGFNNVSMSTQYTERQTVLRGELRRDQ